MSYTRKGTNSNFLLLQPLSRNENFRKLLVIHFHNIIEVNVDFLGGDGEQSFLILTTILEHGLVLIYFFDGRCFFYCGNIFIQAE